MWPDDGRETGGGRRGVPLRSSAARRAPTRRPSRRRAASRRSPRPRRSCAARSPRRRCRCPRGGCRCPPGGGTAETRTESTRAGSRPRSAQPGSFDTPRALSAVSCSSGVYVGPRGDSRLWYSVTWSMVHPPAGSACAARIRSLSARVPPSLKRARVRWGENGRDSRRNAMSASRWATSACSLTSSSPPRRRPSHTTRGRPDGGNVPMSTEAHLERRQIGRRAEPRRDRLADSRRSPRR